MNQITLDSSAIVKIKDLLVVEDVIGLKLRIYVSGGGCSGFQYGFTMDEDVGDDDFVIEQDGAKFVVDMVSAQYLTGAKVDYKTEKFDSQFVIINPNAKSTCGCGSSFNA